MRMPSSRGCRFPHHTRRGAHRPALSIIASALGVALVLASGPGSAQTLTRRPVEAEEQKALATSLVNEGIRAYDAGQHLAALSRFEQAYTLFPSPRLLYWLGRSYQQVGRPVDATVSYERFLASAGTIPAAVRARVNRGLASLRTKVARLEVTSNLHAAQVVVDGKSHGLTPLTAPVVVTAGPHEVVVQKPGAQVFQQRVEAAGGTRVKIHAELVPVPAAPPPPPPPSRR
jgi:hypothetical protein